MENLLSANGNISKLTASLSVYPWDVPEELVELKASHIINVLTRYISSDLSSTDVALWANAIESREDIAVMGAGADRLLQAIHELANPKLGYKLTPSSAEYLIEKLR